ncbi:G-type lectin S-receptor-like serine/threonine-protein kinase At2g19130 [Prunus avium]|uniref:Receptor-like serine/threonine-protein kinase n=1 Tax=Prunus avium TaxID=42229 RepID=A0A6P5RJH9_PRUAV|nr:G-type lectin S-receptor-like serine/threonine-protein kinase At2g19130 [Prunus avium]
MDIASKNNFIISQFVMLLLCLTFNACISMASHTISRGQSLSGRQKITSPSGIFELGFFTPGNSRNYYIGIWYKNLPNQTIVWVANRREPVSKPSSSVLQLLENGNLTLSSPSTVAIWSTNSRSNVSNSTVAMLLDNGNFVIRNAFDSSAVIWQSFDHPTDTLLPGAKLGYNNHSKQELILTSWRSPQNPAPGHFSYKLQQGGEGFSLFWNDYEYVLSYYTFSGYPHNLSRRKLEINGQLNEYVWHKDIRRWELEFFVPFEQCEVYALCGAFSICNQQKWPHCSCLNGFEPKIPEDWKLGAHSDGCVRRTRFQCSAGGYHSFLVMPNVLYPNNSESLLAVANIDECRLACSRNCFCTAFAYDNKCLIWKGEIFNLKQLTPDAILYGNIGKDLYLRIADPNKTDRKTKWIVAGVLAGCLFVVSILMVFIRRRKPVIALEIVENSLLLFKYRDLRSATKNFSEKLGEGGFGSVFKGILPNSTAIAVKELKTLEQGEKQFRAEVGTIGAIHHINLVRLRGFCAETSKRLLVYEYMPNGSLQSLLLQKNPLMLDWKTRYHIAIGTARGLAYLHEECRDCIIHCDIKPENILLDAEYSPKLADFGLAKLMGRHHSRVLTTMRGTVGYLAPEWFSGEAITPKADVFSYGMLLIEVISGRRNREGLDEGLENYRPIQVANVVNKGEDAVTLLDYRLEGQADRDELTRACRVACWCIQEDEKDRPKMTQVVQILEGVSDVSIPPIPQFLQRLIESPIEAINSQEITSSSGSWSCSDVQSASQQNVSN